MLFSEKRVSPIKQRVAVLGPGPWGVASVQVLAENGHEACIWRNEPEWIDEINTKHTNKHYLPELILPISTQMATGLATTLVDMDVVLFVVPTKIVCSVVQKVARHLGTKPAIIHASKRLERSTHKRILEVIMEEIPVEKWQGTVVLSGPSHTEEAAVCDTTAITTASENLADTVHVQELFMNDYFKIYTSGDVIDIETRATLKNIIALGTGTIHGPGSGDNAKATTVTHDLAEISRLGVTMRVNSLAFIGLSGVGDLIVTCTSVHSWNWRASSLLGKGHKLDEVLENMGMIVEGVSATKAAYELAQQLEVEMPITGIVYNVLYNNEDIQRVVREIMLRDGRTGNEFTPDL